LRVTVTGATGLLGPAVIAELRAAGAQVTVLSRNPERARSRLGVQALRWDPMSEPAPVEALAGRDAVLHLAGENVAQRWTPEAKRAIRESRVTGTRHLIEGLRATGASASTSVSPTDVSTSPRGASTSTEGRPGVLVSSSAIGYYGPHGEEPIDEEAPAGDDFLAGVCAAWEAEAERARELGMRVVRVRTGVVLDRQGGALAKMLPPFRLGIGGPVAGGGQYMSWIHREDLVGMMICALERESWSGPINATAPEPVSNRDFSRALGRALHRPSLLPVPGIALRLLYGEMAEIVTTGARVVPAKPLVLGYQFRHPRLEEALRTALG
jgi:NAD dependent epimerase/dehydratase family enzyme